MFLANTIKIFVVIITFLLLQPCNAMHAPGSGTEGKTSESSAGTQTEKTQSAHNFTYSGLFAKQLEAQAKLTCEEKCCWCVCITCLPFSALMCLVPGMYAGALGLYIASLITANSGVSVICATITAISPYVPVFIYVEDLERKKFANVIRTTCSFFIQQNNLDAINEYLFMLTFCDTLKKPCYASCSWKQQATIINEYLNSNGCSCTTEATVQHNSQTGEQEITWKAVWSTKKEA